MANGEIIILPFHDSGHVFPATELASRLAARNYRVTLLLPSAPSSNSSSHLSPLIQIVEHPRSHPPSAPPASSSPPPAPPFQEDFSLFRDLLLEKMGGEDRSARPVCAIVDVMMGQALDVCREFGLPAAIFFTSSACSAAMDYAAAKMRSGESDAPRGLLEEMALSTADLMRAGPPPLRPSGDLAPPPPPFEHPHRGGGPIPPPLVPGGDLASPPPPFEHRHHDGGPIPPSPPPALAQMDGAIALLFNTCDDLEHPFLEYLASEAKKPIWGIGPLLPSQFWSAAGSVLRDGAIRSTTGKGNPGTISEFDVLEFLDSKPLGSVLYVSFGSIVIPSDEELQELTEALKESSHPFIWALQTHTHRPGAAKVYFPEGLAEEAKGRGMVIHGWAPQLLILSHPAVGGFVTHCGWNSTVEALGLGVPVLAWPVHGDQVWNAKLVVRRLRTGLAVKSEDGRMVTRTEVAEGIERVMRDEETRKRAATVASEVFAGGAIKSSEAALGTFLEFMARDNDGGLRDKGNTWTVIGPAGEGEGDHEQQEADCLGC